MWISGDLVLGLLGEARQLPELQLDAGDLCHGAVGCPVGGVGCACPDVHIRVGDLGWGFEGRHQPRADVFLERKQLFIWSIPVGV